jgi:DNA-binding NarL/FixJ family response regulator
MHADGLTSFELAAGIQHLLKTPPMRLLPAIRAVTAGRLSSGCCRRARRDYVRTLQKRGLTDSYHLLTDREKEVIHLLAEGRSNKEVATVLDLGLSTVETHRANLMQKLNLHNTADVVLYAVRKRLIA